MKVILAAVSYFLGVFICAFAFGVVRVLVIAPHIGEIAAVLLEAPIILGLSWIVCGWAVKRFSVPSKSRDLLSMGLIAFLLLMSAEVVLAVLLFGQTFETYFQGFRQPAGVLGLSAQLGFAAMPWIQGALSRRSGRPA
ncbi:MAG: hypothetical protein V4759_05405 [Pseudomonadota bacterium]